MANTPPKPEDDEKDKPQDPPEPDTQATEPTLPPLGDILSGQVGMIFAPDATVEPMSFRYTATLAATVSDRLGQIDTLLWFKELDDWQQAKVKQVLAANPLTQEDQLHYTFAALLTGMELYIEALQQLPEPVA